MPRFRLVLIVVLLALIGVAGYQSARSIWAHHQFHLALEALEHYDFAEAGSRLNSYLSVFPNDPDVLLQAARTARRRGDFEQSWRYLKQAEKNGAAGDPVFVEWQLLRLQTGDMSQAESFKEQCTRNPSAEETTWFLEALIEGGSLNPLTVSVARWGVDFWLQHRSGTLNRVRGLVWRSKVNEFSDELPLAIAALREAVELAPDNVPARIRLVEVLIRSEPRQAIPHLDWLRDKAPENIDVRFQAARLARILGQPEQAAALLDDVIKANPKKVPVLIERGRVAMELHRLDEAERWLLQAHDLAPEWREANLALGDCMRLAGRLDEAKDYQKKADDVLKKLEKKASP